MFESGPKRSAAAAPGCLAPIPTWLAPGTVSVARATWERSIANGATRDGAEHAALGVILAHHPALPLTLLAEAVAAVLISK